MPDARTDDDTTGRDPPRWVTPVGYKARIQDRVWRRLDRALRSRR